VTEAARSRAPWILYVILIAILVATLSLSFANGGVAEDSWFVPLAVMMILGYSTVGTIVASRNPGNPIGWLMIGTGGVFVVGGFFDEYAAFAYLTHPGDLPGGLFAVWVINWIYAVMLTFLPLLGLLFPTGRVPSPRWRFLVPITIGFGVLAALSSMLSPSPVADAPVAVRNPTGVEGFPVDAIGGSAWIGLLLALAAAVAAVFVRYRRSTGEERQQIRWLAYVVITAVVVLLVSLVSTIIVGESFGSTFAGQALAFAGFALVGIGVPVAMGVAILKYRLYELDIVVKKTVVFGIVAVFITLVYLALVLAIPTLVLGAGTDSGINFVTLAATILVALAFNPVRARARRLADRLVYGQRATPYEVLSEFADRLADVYSTEDVLPRMARLVAESTGAAGVRVWLRVRNEMLPAASWPADATPGQAVQTRGDALPSLPGHAVAVRHQAELLGAITLEMPASDPMTPSKEKLVQDVASQAGLVLRNVRLIEELRESRRRIVAAQDERARRLERDIHDGAQQQLVALNVKMRLLEPLVERDPGKARELVGQLQTETTEALENLRDLARGIYPPLLADKGLAAALEAQSRKAIVPVRIEPDGVGRYPQEIESTVYFCVLEALQNVGKYANAHEVTVRLREVGGELAFEIRDDGVGFDPSAVGHGSGLRGMADRVEAVGGTFELSSAPGRGTTIGGRLPVGAAR
jgi:signal transduction histidine kinase